MNTFRTSTHIVPALLLFFLSSLYLPPSSFRPSSCLTTPAVTPFFLPRALHHSFCPFHPLVHTLLSLWSFSHCPFVSIHPSVLPIVLFSQLFCPPVTFYTFNQPFNPPFMSPYPPVYVSWHLLFFLKLLRPSINKQTVTLRQYELAVFVCTDHLYKLNLIILRKRSSHLFCLFYFHISAVVEH